MFNPRSAAPGPLRAPPRRPCPGRPRPAAARGTVQANEALILATRNNSCYRTACCPETTLC